MYAATLTRTTSWHAKIYLNQIYVAMYSFLIVYICEINFFCYRLTYVVTYTHSYV